MSTRTEAARGPFSLDAAGESLLVERARRAVALARRDGERAIASVTVELSAELDASAAVLAARRASDRFFCLELPDRDRFVLASLGSAATLEAGGPARFEDMARAARGLAARVVSGEPGEDPDAPAGSGPVFVGGFAFAPDGGASPEWGSLAPAQLVMPEVSIARHRGEARLTVCVAAEGDEAPGDLVERVLGRLADMRSAAMPLLDPDPIERAQVASAAPPAHYEGAVERGVERIRAGELEKMVLAREVRVHARKEVDPGPILGALRGVFPGCYCWCLGTPELSFVGASPELLLRRDGARAQSVALAGTARRSADPAVDAHLGEQLLGSSKTREEHRIVARRIERTLEPASVWVAAAEEPGVAKVHNVQHLATAIRAQLAEPVSALELAGLLHPTPAVGGEPRAAALPRIPALEGLDRGWYAGGLGWTDLAEDGEFCVALRCALLRGSTAHLYAGCGIVRDPVPADELAESEAKLEALLPLLV